MSWWIVTLREDGDDEDSLYIVEADSEELGVKRAEAQFSIDAACELGATIYVNHVVRCEGPEPTHVRVAKG